MPRLDNSTLPDNNELSSILNTEATRTIPQANIKLHFPTFLLFEEVLKHFDVSTDILNDNNLDIHQVVSRGSSLLATLVPRILADNSLQTIALLDKIYDYLSEQDTPRKSDILFVFGSRTPLRANKAAQIYHRQLVEKIVVSGGNPIYHSGDTETEAAQYREILTEAGVPGNAIITEENSITVPDNVRRSLNLLEQLSLLPRSIIVVNSPYAQRRGWAILKKHLTPDVAIYRVNSECADEYKRENWYKQEKTLRIVLNEFIKMRASVVYNTA
jgi:uncharacterized SAM-binding protein YcdF (DUF218 family)